MNYLRILLVLTTCLLTACGTTFSYLNKEKIQVPYLDDKFDTTAEIETTEELFEVSDEMKAYVKQNLMPLSNPKAKVERLIMDLFDPGVLNIRYENGANVTAQEVFDSGAANCLSLTLLSYALVDEAELEASLMDVKVQENWTFNQGVSLLNGHVNLKVYGKKRNNITTFDFEAKEMTIDFLPMLRAKVIRHQNLSKREFTALYYSNKGAEALLNEDYDLSYAYYKAATQYGPKLSSTWGNLAGLYARLGYFDAAEKAYSRSTQLDRQNLNTQENLAILYNKTDREDLAQAIFKRVHNKRLNNPYYHAMLAQQDYANGDYRRSIRKYQRAFEMNNSEHLFLFGLARNHLMLSNYDQADRYLKRARRLATESHDKRVYQNKISLLQQLVSQR